MLKYIRYAILGIIVLFLVTIAAGNYQSVNLQLTPEWMPFIGGWNFTAPLFVFVYLAAFAGIIIGYLFEYIREGRIRREASRAKKSLKKTAVELEELKKQSGKHDDDVLAILE